MAHLGQEFYRSSYKNCINTLESRDPRTGERRVHLEGPKKGQALSKYVVNREEGGFKKIKVTRSFLRCEILLQPNISNYTFAVLVNVSANNGTSVPGTQPTEQRLKQQDVFFCNRLGFYFYCGKTNGGATAYKFILFTSPTSTFSAGGVDPVQMFALWTSGVLQVTFNNDVLTPAWDMLQHMFIPIIQGDPSGGVGPVWSFLMGEDFTKDGLVVVEPNWVLNGGNDNEYQIVYPQPLSNMGITSTTAQFFLVLKFEGFLAQNCSSLMDNNG